METEKRAVPRIPVNANLRLRAAGSSGAGVSCRVIDSSSDGVRFECAHALDADCEWIEILKSSGHVMNEPLEARIVRRECNEQGHHEIGCAFE